MPDAKLHYSLLGCEQRRHSLEGWKSPGVCGAGWRAVTSPYPYPGIRIRYGCGAGWRAVRVQKSSHLTPHFRRRIFREEGTAGGFFLPSFAARGPVPRAASAEEGRYGGPVPRAASGSGPVPRQRAGTPPSAGPVRRAGTPRSIRERAVPRRVSSAGSRGISRRGPVQTAGTPRHFRRSTFTFGRWPHMCA